jgi:hypothetical protein
MNVLRFRAIRSNPTRSFWMLPRKLIHSAEVKAMAAILPLNAR